MVISNRLSRYAKFFLANHYLLFTISTTR